MQLYFIRHGQSENNLLWEQTGSGEGRSEDPHLTEIGRKQADQLARFLSNGVSSPLEEIELDFQNTEGFGLTHLYTSLMVRAVETGVPIARASHLPLLAWEDAHEWGGIYLDDPETGEPVGQSGHDRVYFQAHYPELVLPETLREDGWWSRPFEEPEQVAARVERFLTTLIARHGGTDDRVAVISHGGFYNNMVRVLLKLPDDGTHNWFILNNAAMTRVDIHADGIDWAYMNRSDYLPRTLIT